MVGDLTSEVTIRRKKKKNMNLFGYTIKKYTIVVIVQR